MTVVERLRAAGCVFAEDEAALLVANVAPGELDAAVARREAGEPLELILGFAEFCGLRVPVAPGLFVPRRRTEFVARLAIAALPRGGRLLDLCCGTGAIAIAVAHSRPDSVVTAADISPEAAAVASASLAPYGASALVSDMDSTLTGPFDVVTACPPYVPTHAIALMAPEARDYEPRIALDGGPDGTGLQALAFAAAARVLRPGGVAIVETSEPQAQLTAQRAREAGLIPSVGRDREIGATAVSATRRSVAA